MFSTTTRLATLISLLLPLTSATFTFNTTYTSNNSSFDATIPSSVGISSACAEAYATTIDCSESFLFSSDEEDDITTMLKDRCTDECILSLRKWRDAIRSDCTAEDIQKANATATTITESDSDSDTYTEGPELLANMATKGVAGVEYMYWSMCTKNLDTSEFCVFDSDYNNSTLWIPSNTTDKDYDASLVPAFCNSSCLTQMSAFEYEIGTTLNNLYGGSNDTPDIADVRKVCPDVDVANFPLVKSLEPVDGSSTSSSSSSSSNGSASNTTAEPNAAGSLKAVSLLGSTLLVGAVVSLGLL